MDLFVPQLELNIRCASGLIVGGAIQMLRLLLLYVLSDIESTNTHTAMRDEVTKVTAVGSSSHYTHLLQASWSFCVYESLIADALWMQRRRRRNDAAAAAAAVMTQCSVSGCSGSFR